MANLTDLKKELENLRKENFLDENYVNSEKLKLEEDLQKLKDKMELDIVTSIKLITNLYKDDIEFLENKLKEFK